MKLFSRLVLATLASLFVCAQPAVAEDGAARVKAELRKQLAETPIDTVRKVPYGGLYEVTVGGEIFYTDDKASYLFLGSIVDLKTKENVTELRSRQINRVAFDQLPLDSAIKIVRGNGSRTVAIFADPNCGYCKRFERDLLGVSDITVYLFLYPILAADSTQKAKAVWCAPDRGKVWVDFMARDKALPTDTSCATPIDSIVKFGKSKRITGTPTMFFEDGERVPGAIAIADFERRLSGSKAPSRASAQ